MDGVKAMGYVDPTPIQLRAIPLVLSGKDVIGSAQTGTGKTAAFGLPILSKLGHHNPVGPRALILEPTRELAVAGGDGHARLRALHGFEGHRRLWRRRLRQAEWMNCTPARTSSSPRRDACSIISNKARCAWTKWNFSSSTKPTGCSTWDFCPTCAGSWKNVRANATARCFPPPFRRRSRRSSNGRCTSRRRLRSARAARRPKRSSTSFIPCPTCRRPTCCSNCSSA